MRITSTMMFTTATLRQLDLTFCNTPARHELHSKHSSVEVLFHALQSVSVEEEFTGLSHSVAVTNAKPHTVGGLQHPDCREAHKKTRLASLSQTRFREQGKGRTANSYVHVKEHRSQIRKKDVWKG